MSVERVERKDGTVVWRVRWRQGGRNRSKVLGRKRDAEAFDAELVRRKRTGELAQLDAGKELLADFGEEWWRLYAEPNLARSTLQVYAAQWDAHVLPRLGSIPLRELTPDVINRFRLELEATGVGRASIRKALTLLQGVLQRACEWGRLSSNPVAPVRKPAVGRARAVVPLAPESVEAMRDWLLRRRLVRDATLVSVLAYAGLRPGEALALTWEHVRDRTLLVEDAVSLGAIESTKTGRRRTVPLLGPLGQDLAAWRLHAGRPPADALVFPGQAGAIQTLANRRPSRADCSDLQGLPTGETLSRLPWRPPRSLRRFTRVRVLVPNDASAARARGRSRRGWFCGNVHRAGQWRAAVGGGRMWRSGHARVVFATVTRGCTPPFRHRRAVAGSRHDGDRARTGDRQTAAPGRPRGGRNASHPTRATCREQSDRGGSRCGLAARGPGVDRRDRAGAARGGPHER